MSIHSKRSLSHATVRLLCSLAFLISARLALSAQTNPPSADTPLAAILDFEAPSSNARPGGWSGGPSETLFVDPTIKHRGAASARIDRPPGSPNPFSSLNRSLPIDFSGRRVELRGWIRTENVSEFAGLWMREDGPTGMLEFENMQHRGVAGTTDWTEYSIELPLHPDARTLFFGFIVGGTGRGWVDHLQLLVDSRPIWEAPKVTRAETVFDGDREFTAGSRIALTQLTPVQIQNLATLGRVWGFLKYHHPNITSGQLHWDFELFRILPEILAANDRSAVSAALLRWIERLGPPSTVARPPPRSADVHLPPDLAWLDDEATLGAALATALKSIHTHRPSNAAQFYVSLTPGVGNPVFEHEPDYRDIHFPDAGYQLLGLFRHWNIIRYWFPYRDLLDDDWEAVLDEFIPRLALAPSADIYALEFMALIARVRDTHANLWSSLHLRPPVGYSQWPIALRFVEGQPVVMETFPVSGEPANPFKRGDLLIAIAGVPIGDLIEQWSPFYAASNQPTRLRDIAQSMGRGPAGPVTVQVRRGADILHLDANRIATSSLPTPARSHDLPGPAFRLLTPDVAYLKLSSVETADISDYVRQASGTKGWIIDIRNYPAQFVVFSLGSQFVDRMTDFARFTNADLAEPGRFVFTTIAPLPPPRPLPGAAAPSVNLSKATFADRPDFPASHTSSANSIEWSSPNHASYIGKLVILVDEMTQSQAEYTAMALRATPRAIVIGSTTAGADGNVSPISLPGGLRTAISGIGIFYPDKRPTQRVGIVPDIEVQPTLAGIRAHRDEVLEEALRQILGAATPVEEITRLASPTEG